MTELLEPAAIGRASPAGTVRAKVTGTALLRLRGARRRRRVLPPRAGHHRPRPVTGWTRPTAEPLDGVLRRAHPDNRRAAGVHRGRRTRRPAGRRGRRSAARWSALVRRRDLRDRPAGREPGPRSTTTTSRTTLTLTRRRGTTCTSRTRSTRRSATDTAAGRRRRGDGRGATSRVEQTYTTAMYHNNPMEPHATTALWDGRPTLDAVGLHAGRAPGRGRPSPSVFGLDTEHVRVICPYVGGGFGSKGTPHANVVLAAMAARGAARPGGASSR